MYLAGPDAAKTGSSVLDYRTQFHMTADQLRVRLFRIQL